MSYLKLLQSMKKNAPRIFETYVERKIANGERTIEELRILYARARENKNTEDMVRYEKTAAQIKKEIEVYRDVNAQMTI